MIRAKVPGLRLGDAVHVIAHPVAKVIDAVAGSRLANCGGCAERRRRLNAMTGSDARKWPPADEATWI